MSWCWTVLSQRVTKNFAIGRGNKAIIALISVGTNGLISYPRWPPKDTLIESFHWFFTLMNQSCQQVVDFVKIHIQRKQETNYNLICKNQKCLFDVETVPRKNGGLFCSKMHHYVKSQTQIKFYLWCKECTLLYSNFECRSRCVK